MMTFHFHEEDRPAEKVLGLPAPPSVGTGAGRQGGILNRVDSNVEKLMKNLYFW
jgi:hypothetical protein